MNSSCFRPLLFSISGLPAIFSIKMYRNYAMHSKRILNRPILSGVVGGRRSPTFFHTKPNSCKITVFTSIPGVPPLRVPPLHFLGLHHCLYCKHTKHSELFRCLNTIVFLKSSLICKY